MTSTQAVLWGCLGGILPDTLRLIGLRYQGAPEYVKTRFFWVSMVLLVGVAGITAYLLAPSRIVDAVALGFSAPEILSNALRAKQSEPLTAQPPTRFRTRDHMHLEQRPQPVSKFVGQLRGWWAT